MNSNLLTTRTNSAVVFEDRFVALEFGLGAVMSRSDNLQFSKGAKIGPYELVSGIADSSASMVEPIGSGGSAFVFKAMQNLTGEAWIPRAIKIFKMREDIAAKRVAAEMSEGVHTFFEEIQTIASLNHQNIVKIIDAGHDDEERPFFVMEFVDGPTLKDLVSPESPLGKMWAEAANVDPFVVLDICQQISAALSYLHQEGRYHFDIAPKNIFVRSTPDKPHVLLGDLGVSKSLIGKSGILDIAGTRKYAPEIIQNHLDVGQIDCDILRDHAEYWDIFALCKVAKEVMGAWGVANHGKLRPLNILCDRVLNDQRRLSAAQFGKELERLSPDHVRTAGIDELSNDAVGIFRFVTLPVRQVPVSKRVNDIFSHHTLTRLQQVPQLMLYRSAHPGGVHTTYEHVLGTYGLMVRAMTKLLRKPEFRASFAEKELEEALLSAILIRIGSYPLERIVRSLKPQTPEEKIDDFRRMIDRNSGEPENLNSLISKSGGFRLADIDSVLDIVCRPREDLDQPYQKIISSLLKSSIDMRVMDYIIRDSHHTGIPAGDGIDVDHILDSLIWDVSIDSIGINRRGVFSCEHLLCARYWMFSRLYWNSPNRSTTAMLRHVIFDIYDELGITPESLSVELRGFDEAGALNFIAKQLAKTSSVDKGDHSIIMLLQRPRPRNYTPLIERFALNWKDKAADRDVVSGLRSMEKIRLLGPMGLHQLEREFYDQFSRRGEVKRSEIVFDFTDEHPLKLGEDISVEIRKGVYQPLSESSPICKVLPDSFRQSAVRFRAFVHPRFEKDDRISMAVELGKFLDDKFGDDI